MGIEVFPSMPGLEWAARQKLWGLEASVTSSLAELWLWLGQRQSV